MADLESLLAEALDWLDDDHGPCGHHCCSEPGYPSLKLVDCPRDRMRAALGRPAEVPEDDPDA